MSEKSPPIPLEILPLLVKGGFLTPTMRRVIEAFSKKWDITPFHAILLTEVMPENDLADALATLCSVDRLFHISSLPIDEEALKVIGFKRAREWECIALQTEDGTLDLVLADPTQYERTSQLKQELKRELTLAVAERSDIVGAIDELFPLAAQLPSLFHSAKT
jgi:hypothetical protein